MEEFGTANLSNRFHPMLWQERPREGFHTLRDNKEIYDVMEGKWVLEVVQRISMVSPTVAVGSLLSQDG